MVQLILFIIMAYLLGSLSSAVIYCHLAKLPDPRTHGSMNPGATNVLRLGGKKAAIITLLGDGLKGFLPVIIASILGIKGFPLALIAFAAFIGHLFPIFFQFRGGKGVATFFGLLLGLSGLLGIAALATWLLIAYLFRYSSLAALVTAGLVPIYGFLLGATSYVPVLAVISLILIGRHHENIKRLLRKEESKIGNHNN